MTIKLFATLVGKPSHKSWSVGFTLSASLESLAEFFKGHITKSLERLTPLPNGDKPSPAAVKSAAAVWKHLESDGYVVHAYTSIGGGVYLEGEHKLGDDTARVHIDPQGGVDPH